MRNKLLLTTAIFALLVLLTLSINATESIKKGLIVLEFGALFWITEALPLAITSLLIPVIGCFLGLTSIKEAFSSFAHPIIFLFFGGFSLATALSKYSLDRFIAYKIVSLSKGSFIITSFLLFTATALTSMWISNTSTTAMMLPLALGLLGTLPNPEDRIKNFLLLGIAYSSSVGGIGTLVGSPPNGITAAELGMGFSDWLKVGLPTVALLLPLLFLILFIYFKPKGKGKIKLEKLELKLTRERGLLLLTFSLTVLGWLFSKKLSELLAIGKYFDAVVAVMAVAMLFIFKLVNWKEIEEGTDWGTLYLFGGGITLSHLLKTSGASKFLANWFINITSNLPLILLIFSIVLFMIFLTELMSNTATAAIFVPILITAAKSLNLPPQMLALPAGIAASCAFMLPVSTPPNAIIYGTGLVKRSSMLKVGLILNLTFSIAISLVIYLMLEH